MRLTRAVNPQVMTLPPHFPLAIYVSLELCVHCKFVLVEDGRDKTVVRCPDNVDTKNKLVKDIARQHDVKVNRSNENKTKRPNFLYTCW